LYLYHIDLWDEFKTLLFPFKEHIKLYLCLSKEKDNDAIAAECGNYFDSIITYHENYGADIASFLNILESIQEPYFIKIHSKISYLGIHKHINWRAVLLNDFFYSNKLFNNNFLLIQQDNIGMIGNRSLVYKNYENSHTKKIKKLCSQLGIDYGSIPNRSFFGGSMFMSHTDLFKKHFLPHNDSLQTLLAKEKGKVDETKGATFSHSLERIFGYIISINNLSFAHPQYNIIKIKNTNIDKQFFSLILMYNQDVYIQEEINLYGHMLDYEPDKKITIQWKHLSSHPTAEYHFSAQNTIERSK
jgi:hypothetical protein